MMNSDKVDNKKLIQDTYDKGDFRGLSYDEQENKIRMAVRNKKHWDVVTLKSEYPKKEFSELAVFAETLGKPKKEANGETA